MIDDPGEYAREDLGGWKGKTSCSLVVVERKKRK